MTGMVPNNGGVMRIERTAAELAPHRDAVGAEALPGWENTARSVSDATATPQERDPGMSRKIH